MEHNRYIGPTAKFKEVFVFLHQKMPAIQVNFLPSRQYAEISRLAESGDSCGLTFHRFTPTSSNKQMVTAASLKMVAPLLRFPSTARQARVSSHVGARRRNCP
jgi:hypothetical protein